MTNYPPLNIRTLDFGEIPRAVTIHQEAFPGFFLTFLGPSFLKLLYRFYVQGETEVALAGEYNGQIVATLLGTTQPQRFYKRLATRHFLTFVWASLKPLLRQPKILPRLIRALLYRGEAPSCAIGGALLSSVCIDPIFQGKGIGKKMITTFESEMWKRGAKFLYLLTDRDNNQATHNFYEKLGWSVEIEFSTHEGRHMRRYWKKAQAFTDQIKIESTPN